MEANSIIREQKFSVRTSDKDTAFLLQKTLNKKLHDEINPYIERLIDSKNKSQKIIEIQTLKIDLGCISYEDFEKSFTEIIIRKLGDELEKNIQQAVQNDLSDPVSDYIHIVEKQKGEKTSRYKIKDYHLKALIHYLQHGCYPWWYRKMSFVQPPRQIFESSTEEELLQITRLGLRENFEEAYFKRLLNFLPRINLKNLLGQLVPFIKANNVRELIIAYLSTFNVLVALAWTDDEKISRAIFTFICFHFNSSLSTEALLTLSVEYFEKETVSGNDFKKNTANWLKKMSRYGEEPSDTHIYKLFRLFSEYIKSADNEARENISNKQIFPGFTHNEVDSFEKIAVSPNKKAVTPNKIEPSKNLNIAEQKEGFYIGNAGLIILHPFLEALFTEFGLLSTSNVFQSEYAASKANVVLNYLLNGKDQYEECEMVLNKVMCGLDPETLIDFEIKLSDTEKNECETLLKTVISYWDALKSTSIAGLQETFFLRDGKLIEKEEHWLLQIEQKTVDILVGSLPWGFGVIKFSWLQKPIYVEW